MAKAPSASFKVFLVDGVSLLGSKPKAAPFKIVNLTEPATGLGDEWEEHDVTGMRRAEFAQSGAFFDDEAGSMHAAFKAAGNASRIVTLGMFGNTIGQPFVGMEGTFLASYAALPGPPGALAKADAEYTVTGEMQARGAIVNAWGARTANWDTTASPVDNGASSADGGVGYLQISAASGFTNFVGRILHSSDNGATDPYSALVTFTDSVVVGAQRIAVAGTIKQWLIFDGVVTGTGSITVFAGFARNSQQ